MGIYILNAAAVIVAPVLLGLGKSYPSSSFLKARALTL